MNRILRAKYLDSDNSISFEEHKDRVSIYFDEILGICGYDGKYPIHKAVAEIRWGLFAGNDWYTADGLADLKGLGSDAEEVYKMMLADIEQFKFFSDLSANKKYFDQVIGKAIREHREEIGLPIEELAKIVGIPHETITGIENGTNIATNYDVFKLATTVKYRFDIDDTLDIFRSMG
ncbi:MAG: helix-turn-helix domain-containing protein [Defluviitaleaceae bacterium]|nr:helix-turn-helix domain-containing protein [Defluviitaleaceae bacterium]